MPSVKQLAQIIADTLKEQREEEASARAKGEASHIDALHVRQAIAYTREDVAGLFYLCGAVLLELRILRWILVVLTLVVTYGIFR